MGSIGPILGLLTAVVLIIRRCTPFWGLVSGAVLGGFLGGGTATEVLNAIFHGVVGMLPTVVCILASGVLAGALVKTGSAEKIAETILRLFGAKWSLAAIACAVLLLTASGVFVDIAIITAAPIAITVGRRAGYTRSSILLVMIGGGKAGNIISPNPNTLAAAKAFGLEVTSLIGANLLPAFLALSAALLLASQMKRGREELVVLEANADHPPLWAALSGPVTVMFLLLLRPLAGIPVEPAAALPIGGAVCVLACSKGKSWKEILLFGLGEVSGVALVLLGTGALSGVMQASSLQTDLVWLLEWLHLPVFLLAPFSGILMGGAASSTTAGTAIACETFGGILERAGIPAISAAAMIHAGATVLDSLPHGSFFHATAGCADLDFEERMKLVPLEACIGLTATAAAIGMYWLKL